MKKQAGGFAAMLQKMDEKQTDKLAAKLPSWAGFASSLTVPSSLALEQCSSEATARRKAAVARAAAGSGSRIADLTGGLGVDSWAFSLVFGGVLYNEMNAGLAEAVESNFAVLNAHNVEFCHEEVSPASLDGSLGARLKEFSPDVIYLDPARRNRTGGKVFLPEDCSPDITAILPRLLDISPNILVKMSPVMDITLLVRRLPQIREIHVVGTDGECKELLCVIGREKVDCCKILAEELGRDGSVAGSICRMESQAEGTDAVGRRSVTCADASDLVQGHVLHVPSATALKSGCHSLMAEESGLKKLDRFTHIYAGCSPAGSPFFKHYAILDTLPLNNGTIKQVAAEHPGADVTARGIPLTSDQLREKMFGKTSQGGSDCHIFGVSTASCGRVIITTKKI